MLDKNTAIVLYTERDDDIPTGMEEVNSLKSILSNSILPKYIYILVDSIESFSSYIKNDVEIVFCKKYKNRATSLNKCIEQMPNEIIFLGFLNSCDIYEKNKIEESIDICKNYPVVGCVVNDNYYGLNIAARKKSFNIKTLLTSYCYDPNYFVRLDLLRKAKLEFNQNLSLREDYDMLIKISKVGLIFHTPQILNSYNFNLSNSTKEEEETIRKNV